MLLGKIVYKQFVKI